MGQLVPEDRSGGETWRRCRLRQALALLVGLCGCALLLVSCSVEGDECDADSDCASGEICQSAGGVFARGSVCLPESSDDVPTLEGDDASSNADTRRSDGADLDVAGSEVDATGFFDSDPRGWPTCEDPDCDCDFGGCRRRCREGADCTVSCGLASDCNISCPDDNDCEINECQQSSCAMACRDASECRIDQCTQGECRLRCEGPDCTIEACLQSDCTLICLGGTCSIEQCKGGSRCRLECRAEQEDCDLRCEGRGCECEGPDGCSEP